MPEGLYRLGVVKMRVPSLNERGDDILSLAKHFLVEFCRDFGKEFSGISPEAAAALKAYDWRGNVRELKNLIEQALKLAGGNESKAAKLLKMNYHTFRYHRKKLQVR